MSLSCSRSRIHLLRRGSSLCLILFWCCSIVASSTANAGATNHLRAPPFRRFLSSSEAEDSEEEEIQVTFTTNPSSDDDEPTPSRVVLDPLTVRLSPRTSVLSAADLGFLQDSMETLAMQYILEQGGGGSRRHLQQTSSSSELEYIRFGVPKEVHNEETAIVSFALVVAQYTNHPTPEVATLEQWILQSLVVDKLLPVLQSDVSLAGLTNVSVAFVPSASAPVPSPTSAPVAEITRDSSSEESSDILLPVILGASIFGLVLVAAALLAVKRRRREAVIPVERAVLTDDDLSPKKRPRTTLSSTPASTPETTKEEAPPAATNTDSRSVADSESEWTVGTEAGDSMALKSLVPPAALHQPEPWGVWAESFERDRPVAISKDMLTGQWSGRVTHLRHAAAAQSDSVLQPSYFSASQERRVRKAAARDRSAECSAEDEEDSVGGEDALVFQAHEDAGGRHGRRGEEPTAPSRMTPRRGRASSPHPTAREMS